MKSLGKFLFRTQIAAALLCGGVGAEVVAAARANQTTPPTSPSPSTSSTLTATPSPATTTAPASVQVLTLDLGCAGERNKLTDQERVARAQKILEDFPVDIVFVARGECAATALAAATHRTWIALPGAGRGAGVITSWAQSPAKVGELWKGLGVRLAAPNGREVVVFAIAFPFAPYQPYQLCGVPHDEQPFLNSAEAAQTMANTTRGLQSEQLAVAARAATAAGYAVIAAGMVNEPSASDWCDQAVAAELCPMRVAWPSVRNIERAGLRDAFRTAHVNVVESAGATWPALALKRDRSDRVDFIFTNTRLRCEAIDILGESGAASVRNPKPLAGGLPGEHRALRGQFQWTETSWAK